MDRIGRGRLAAAAVATRFIEPVDLLFDLAFEFLKCHLKLVHVHGRAIVFGDKGCSRGAIDGYSFTALH